MAALAKKQQKTRAECVKCTPPSIVYSRRTEKFSRTYPTLVHYQWTSGCWCVSATVPYCSNTETKLSVARCFIVSHMILLEMPAAPQQGACGSGSPNSYLKAHQRDVKQRCSTNVASGQRPPPPLFSCMQHV